jgi:hypothetical protein
MKRVFFVIALSTALTSPALAAANDTLDAPPSGITPTTTTLAQIFKAYDAATGRITPGIADTRHEAWTFTKAGLSGTETLVRSGTDYYSRIARGPLVDEYGQFFGHGWHRDPNGVVTPVSTPQYTSFEMLRSMRNLEDAEDPKNDVTVLGEVLTPKAAYVVQIKPSGEKHPEFAFYDKQTGLVDRFDLVADDTRITITYDDYRASDGLTQPWHMHFTDGTAALDDDFVRRSLTIGKPVDIKQFAIPTSNFAFVYYNGHQSLPVKIYDDYWTIYSSKGSYTEVAPTIVVRLYVAGRGYDFAVSAGEPRSLIDFDVAEQLHLPSYGQVTHAEGEDVSYDTILPQADWAAGLLLRNWVLHATPFHYHLNEGTKVVGVIGNDVLASGVFKIDYVKSVLDVYSPSAFDGPQPAEARDAYTLPIEFDSGLPFFSGSIGGETTSNILFDNDFDMSMVFGTFTTRYPNVAKDLDTGKSHTATMIPFADTHGYGEEVDTWLAKIDDLQFGPAHFGDIPILASDGDSGFGARDVDAVMGGNLVRFYDVYLDYRHNRILLRPNKWFYQAFQTRSQ